MFKGGFSQALFYVADTFTGCCAIQVLLVGEQVKMHPAIFQIGEERFKPGVGPPVHGIDFG